MEGTLSSPPDRETTPVPFSAPEPDLDAGRPVFGLIEDDFTGWFWGRCGQVIGHELSSVRLPSLSVGWHAGVSRTGWPIV